jgi:hypothetical protein
LFLRASSLFRRASICIHHVVRSRVRLFLVIFKSPPYLPTHSQ